MEIDWKSFNVDQQNNIRNKLGWLFNQMMSIWQTFFTFVGVRSNVRYNQIFDNLKQLAETIFAISDNKFRELS